MKRDIADDRSQAGAHGEAAHSCQEDVRGKHRSAALVFCGSACHQVGERWSRCDRRMRRKCTSSQGIDSGGKFRCVSRYCPNFTSGARWMMYETLHTLRLCDPNEKPSASRKCTMRHSASPAMRPDSERRLSPIAFLRQSITTGCSSTGLVQHVSLHLFYRHRLMVRPCSPWIDVFPTSIHHSPDPLPRCDPLSFPD